MVKPLDELHFYGFDSSSVGSLGGRQKCKSYPVQIANRIYMPWEGFDSSFNSIISSANLNLGR